VDIPAPPSLESRIFLVIARDLDSKDAGVRKGTSLQSPTGSAPSPAARHPRQERDNFRDLKRGSRFRRMRWIGLSKAKFQVHLAVIAYNCKRIGACKPIEQIGKNSSAKTLSQQSPSPQCYLTARLASDVPTRQSRQNSSRTLVSNNFGLIGGWANIHSQGAARYEAGIWNERNSTIILG
jgi:hypothetical protein